MVKTIEFLVKYGYTDASLQERRQKCLVLQQRSMFQAGPAHIADTILNLKKQKGKRHEKSHCTRSCTSDALHGFCRMQQAERHSGTLADQ